MIETTMRWRGVMVLQLLLLRLLLCVMDVAPSKEPTVVWLGESVLQEKTLKRLEQVVTAVEAYGRHGYARQRRKFGEDGDDGGHFVTYLHKELGKRRNRRLLRALWDVAMRADREADWRVATLVAPPAFNNEFEFKDAKGDLVRLEGYGEDMKLFVNDKPIFTGLQEFNGTELVCKKGHTEVPERKRDALQKFLEAKKPEDPTLPRITLRCAEAIEYVSGKKSWSTDSKDESNPPPSDLGWHDDGHTLITIAFLLSTPGKDFKGGEIEISRRPGGHSQLVNAKRGDAVAWRGWDDHRVNSVTAGKRQLVVLEWWNGPGPDDANLRPSDFVYGAREALSLDPASPNLHLTLGFALRLAGLHIANAPFRSPNSSEAIAEQDAAENQKEFQNLLIEGIEEFQVAAELDPSFLRAFRELGVTQAMNGLLEEASYSLQTALAMKPTCEYTNVHLGHLRKGEGNMTGAEQHFQQATQTNPREPQIHIELALLQVHKGDVSSGEDSYRRALALDPRHERALNLLGVLLADQPGQAHAEAVDLLRRAAELHPHVSAAHYDLGVLYHEQEQLDEAEQYFKKAATLNPLDERSWNNLGLVHAKKGDDDAANASYQSALEVAPDDSLVLQNLGALQLRLQDPISAEHCFRRALVVDPANPETNLRLALSMLEQDEHIASDQARSLQAIGALRLVVDLVPDHAEAHFNLGELLKQSGATTEAIVHLRAAWELEPADVGHQEGYQMLREELDEESDTGEDGRRMVHDELGDEGDASEDDED